jgi:hypothetical protein
MAALNDIDFLCGIIFRWEGRCALELQARLSALHWPSPAASRPKKRTQSRWPKGLPVSLRQTSLDFETHANAAC